MLAIRQLPEQSKLDLIRLTGRPVQRVTVDVRAQLKKVSGMVHCYSSWSASGTGSVFAMYESQELAKAATDQVLSVWGSLASMLTAPPTSSEYENVVDLKG